MRAMSIFIIGTYTFGNHNKITAKWLKEILTHKIITSK